MRVATLLADLLVAMGAAWILAACLGGATTKESSWYVAPGGNDSNSCRQHAPCATIARGVAVAAPGDTVSVLGAFGVAYAGNLMIAKRLSLVGQNQPVIDASGDAVGIQAIASNVSIEGFTVQNAVGEGILVGWDAAPGVKHPVLSGETIRGNRLLRNNTGFAGLFGRDSKCAYGDDCGGGVHFNAVTYSSILDNEILFNADGILLTDDYGPNHDNLIQGNLVADNLNECGIALPGHNPFAVTFAPSSVDHSVLLAGQLNPTVAGIYRNTVRANHIFNNGTIEQKFKNMDLGGSGAGVLIATTFPGSAVYDNVIEDNYIAASGMAGVTIHAHHGVSPGGAPPDGPFQTGGEYLSGNKITNNVISTNNTVGDGLDVNFPGVRTSPEDFETTGILIYTVSPMKIAIANNEIDSNYYGIWQVPSAYVFGNDFGHDNNFLAVTMPVFVSPSV